MRRPDKTLLFASYYSYNDNVKIKEIFILCEKDLFLFFFYFFFLKLIEAKEKKKNNVKTTPTTSNSKTKQSK